MPLPWLRLIDGVLSATDLVRVVRGRRSEALPVAPPPDSPLAAVVVSALREAFNRDHERLTLERQRLEEEQARAERALRLEWLRQAGERELGRLRLLIGVAVVTLIGSLFLLTRVSGGAPSARLLVGAGGLLLLGSLAAAFSGQQRVARTLACAEPHTTMEAVIVSPGGRAASWLLVAALGAIAVGVLIV